MTEKSKKKDNVLNVKIKTAKSVPEETSTSVWNVKTDSLLEINVLLNAQIHTEVMLKPRNALNVQDTAKLVTKQNVLIVKKDSTKLIQIIKSASTVKKLTELLLPLNLDLKYAESVNLKTV